MFTCWPLPTISTRAFPNGASYIAFATSPEGTTTWARSTGYMPVRISARQNPEMVQFFEENPNFKLTSGAAPILEDLRAIKG